jgi:hypothetical protein
VRDLKTTVEEFRAAIERCDSRSLPAQMEGFPRGCCGDATLLLGTHLAVLGFGTFIYVAGERGIGSDWTSHAWLEGEGFLIDITADQFAEVNDPAIVCNSSPWHGTFEVTDRRPSDFRNYDEHTCAVLGSTYAAIVKELRRLQPQADADA